MRYRVEGNTLPVAILQLEAGESIISEAGGRTWSRGMIETETQARGGAAKSIGRMFAGESLFMSKYTAKAPAEIAFASSFPGRILVRELKAGESIDISIRMWLSINTPNTLMALEIIVFFITLFLVLYM